MMILPPPTFITETKLSKFLALTLFILLPLIGFKLGVEYQKLLNETQNSLPPPNINLYRTPTPSDSIPNWKTYRNEEYELEFQYPSQIVLYAENNQLALSTNDLRYDNSLLAAGMSIDISVTQVQNENEALDYLNTLVKQGGQNEEILIDGSKALKRTVIVSEETYSPTAIIVGIIRNNTLYTVLGKIASRPQENTQLFNQILSSFKFLDASQDFQAKERCEELTGDKCFPDGSAILTGTVIENRNQGNDSDTNIDRYLLIRTKDGLGRKIVYYHSSKYEACVTENSDIAKHITAGQTIEVVGDPTNDTHTEVWTCSSDYYYIKVLNPQSSCEQANGKWLVESSECEQINEQKCTSAGGTYNGCASACRNNKNNDMCTNQCVSVCSFNY